MNLIGLHSEKAHPGWKRFMNHCVVGVALGFLMAIDARVLHAQSLYAVQGPAPAGYDRQAGQRATREHLERLIRLDTQNPPRNELITAR
jgi:hypothetical protein